MRGHQYAQLMVAFSICFFAHMVYFWKTLYQENSESVNLECSVL